MNSADISTRKKYLLGMLEEEKSRILCLRSCTIYSLLQGWGVSETSMPEDVYASAAVAFANFKDCAIEVIQKEYDKYREELRGL